MVDQLIEQIIQNPLFLKLKNVVENNSYHDHETTFDHLIKTKDTALREISGEFITNTEAKTSFVNFVNEEIEGLKRGDIMVLTALIHDIGKMLYVKEGSNTHPLPVNNASGITTCPGHEYWGSTIADQVLKDLSIPSEVISYIASIVRLHDTFNADYWKARSNWPMDFLINDVKSRAENFYKEALFNIYCDCFTANTFQEAKEMIVKVFNEPELYGKREYIIA